MATRTTRLAGGGTCDGGGGMRTRGHDGTFLAKASIQGKRKLDMEDAEGGPEDEGAGRLRSRH